MEAREQVKHLIGVLLEQDVELYFTLFPKHVFTPRFFLDYTPRPLREFYDSLDTLPPNVVLRELLLMLHHAYHYVYTAAQKEYVNYLSTMVSRLTVALEKGGQKSKEEEKGEEVQQLRKRVRALERQVGILQNLPSQQRQKRYTYAEKRDIIARVKNGSSTVHNGVIALASEYVPDLKIRDTVELNFAQLPNDFMEMVEMFLFVARNLTHLPTDDTLREIMRKHGIDSLEQGASSECVKELNHYILTRQPLPALLSSGVAASSSSAAKKNAKNKSTTHVVVLSNKKKYIARKNVLPDQIALNE